MNRKTKNVTIGGVEYTVNELSARQMLPLVQNLTDSGEDQSIMFEAQITLINTAVTVAGAPVDSGELGMGTFMQLMQEVMAINGMGEEEKND